MTSYTQYSGPSGFDISTSYTFERLDAAVFGTIVDVTCVNATASYNVTTTRNPYAVLYNFEKNSVVNTTLLLDRNYPSLPIGSVVTEQNGEPLHTFLIPDSTIYTPLVLECTYGGNEILASISLSDRTSPLQVNGSVTYGSPLNATVKWQLSNMTHDCINGGSSPGSLADGWFSSGYYPGYMYENAAPTMGKILSELGQAYFSLLRQNIENANQIRTSDQMLDNGSFVKMVVSVLRVGGSSDTWLLIYALMFITAMHGAVMATVQGRVLPWSPQDPVEILQKCLPAANIDELTPLGYREEFKAIDGDGARQSTTQCSVKQRHAQHSTLSSVITAVQQLQRHSARNVDRAATPAAKTILPASMFG